MAAVVSIMYKDDTDNIREISCNYAKVRDGCLQIAHYPKEDEHIFEMEYIPLHMISWISVKTSKGEDREDETVYNS